MKGLLYLVIGLAGCATAARENGATQQRERLAFAKKPRCELLLVIPVQDLERDMRAAVHGFGFVDVSHRAAADTREHAIPTGHGSDQSRLGCGLGRHAMSA